MFSRTTIESSTRMPTVSASPIKLMKLKLIPSRLITPKVEIRLVGIASSTMTVLRKVCRNTSSTRPVRRTASTSSCCTSETLFLIYGAESQTSARVTPPGSLLRSEEHTSELQSHSDLVCRLLLEKKK